MSDRFKQSYTCVIGVGGDLPTVLGDAAGLINILEDPARCAYLEDQVQLLAGQKAGRSHIISALKQLPIITNAESKVLVDSIAIEGNAAYATIMTGNSSFLNNGSVGQQSDQ
jgi:hypothetical protein